MKGTARSARGRGRKSHSLRLLTISITKEQEQQQRTGSSLSLLSHFLFCIKEWAQNKSVNDRMLHVLFVYHPLLVVYIGSVFLFFSNLWLNVLLLSLGHVWMSWALCLSLSHTYSLSVSVKFRIRYRSEGTIKTKNKKQKNKKRKGGTRNKHATKKRLSQEEREPVNWTRSKGCMDVKMNVFLLLIRSSLLP